MNHRGMFSFLDCFIIFLDIEGQKYVELKVYGETHLSISLLPVFSTGWRNSYEILVVFEETIIDRQFAAMSNDKNHSFLLNLHLTLKFPFVFKSNFC